MSTFGITPVTGFPPASDEGFPRFLQFQQDGVDVGDTTVEVVNFTGNVEVSVDSTGTILTVHVGAAP